MTSKKKKVTSMIVVQIALFLVLFIYFTQITPLLPFDADDWSTLGTMRLPIPLWGVFNPSKVLPEVIGPLVGEIAAYVVYPISKNYVDSILFTQAVLVSLCVATLLYLFYLFLVRKMKMTLKQAISGELFMFLSLFFLFKHLNSASYSGIWASDFNCYFHYLIPGLLNASVLLVIMTEEDFTKQWANQSNIYKGFFFVALYFAIFSSSQLNIILAAYIIVDLAVRGFEYVRQGNKEPISNLLIYFVTIGLWLISVLFDLHGRRASMVTAANSGSLNEKIASIVTSLKTLIGSFNSKILVLYCLVIVASLFLSAKNKKDRKTASVLPIISMLFCALLISFVYLLFAYSKAGVSYVGRVDAMWSPIWFFILSSCIGVAYLVKEYNSVRIAMPLVLVIMALISFNFDYLPVQSSVDQHSASTIRQVDNYMIKQIVKADREGKAKVTVKVPWGDGEVNPKDLSSNWPHAYYMAKWMQNTLYSHGIIRSRIQITFKPDKKLNKKFYENRTKQQPFTALETR